MNNIVIKSIRQHLFEVLSNHDGFICSDHNSSYNLSYIKCDDAIKIERANCGSFAIIMIKWGHDDNNLSVWDHNPFVYIYYAHPDDQIGGVPFYYLHCKIGVDIAEPNFGELANLVISNVETCLTFSVCFFGYFFD